MSNRPDRALLAATLGAATLNERPHLFSGTCIELPAAELATLAAFVQAVTALVATPAYRQAVAERDGLAIAPMPPGVCLGFDFHRSADGPPQLIEINTNAGGSLLVTLLNRAWGFAAEAEQADAALVAMFENEWAAWGSGRTLARVAIVDDAPEQQYLYPEFLRWQALFESHGLRALICSPEALRCDTAGRLWHGEQSIDLLYNRLTDFALKTDTCAAIAQAWAAQQTGQSSGTLMSPHPQAHALWADKRNLAWLSDTAALQSFGLDAGQIEQISRCVPRTVPVRAEDADAFWTARKTLFFKPQAGFGSRATYRGDKLTKRVFDEILQGGYVAQIFVPPPEIAVPLPTGGSSDESLRLKYDLRVYAYTGKIQLLAARLYQGQTTNFRTPGGGFAPVRVRFI